MSNIYHLEQNHNNSFATYSRCNSKSSYNWTKYRESNFRKGTIINLVKGIEIPIPGRKCRKCELLLKFEK